MLRLVTTREHETVTILVEGRMVADSLTVLEAECERELPRGGELTLDLSGVTDIGPAGIRLLRRLRAAGIHLSGVPGLVAEMLDLNG